jgi:hypothetical protein
VAPDKIKENLAITENKEFEEITCSCPPRQTPGSDSWPAGAHSERQNWPVEQFSSTNRDFWRLKLRLTETETEVQDETQRKGSNGRDKKSEKLTCSCPPRQTPGSDSRPAEADPGRRNWSVEQSPRSWTVCGGDGPGWWSAADPGYWNRGGSRPLSRPITHPLSRVQSSAACSRFSWCPENGQTSIAVSSKFNDEGWRSIISRVSLPVELPC